MLIQNLRVLIDCRPLLVSEIPRTYVDTEKHMAYPLHTQTLPMDILAEGIDIVSAPGELPYIREYNRRNSCVDDKYGVNNIPLHVWRRITGSQARGIEIYNTQSREQEPKTNTSICDEKGHSNIKGNSPIRTLIYTGVRSRALIWQAWWDWLFSHISSNSHQVSEEKRSENSRLPEVAVENVKKTLTQKFWWEIYQNDQLSLQPMTILKDKLLEFESGLHDVLFVKIKGRENLQATFERLRDMKSSLALSWWFIFWMDLRYRYGSKAPDPLLPNSRVRNSLPVEEIKKLLQPINEIRRDYLKRNKDHVKTGKAISSDVIQKSHPENPSSLLPEYATDSPIDIQAQKVIEEFQRLQNYDQIRRFWMHHSFNLEEVVFESRVPCPMEKRTKSRRASSYAVPARLQHMVQRARKKMREEKRSAHKAMKEMDKLPEEIQNTMKLITSLCRNTPRSVLKKIERKFRDQEKNTSLSAKKCLGTSKSGSSSLTREQDDGNRDSLDCDSGSEWVDKKVSFLEDEASTEDSDDQEIKNS
mmetsp:Transcript_3695/g.5830  ORF Transcript_3695/g.5830 Transcript_3695/m.5830 type:complete len:530 (-) Transcript_3695:841-2430(-)